VRLSHIEDALSWLTRALFDRDRLILELPVDPQFDTCRGDSRFEALVASLPTGHSSLTRQT
jgi:hypothetical protein